MPLCVLPPFFNLVHVSQSAACKAVGLRRGLHVGTPQRFVGMWHVAMKAVRT